MRELPTISNVRARTAPPLGLQSGLLAIVDLTLNDTVRIEGIPLRRSLEGRLVLSFPVCCAPRARASLGIRPISDGVRRAIEEQVFRALGIKAEEVSS